MNNEKQTQAPANVQAPAPVQAPVNGGYDFTISTTGQTAVPAFTSIDTSTAAGKKLLYKITNHADYNISDFINKPIAVTGIYVDVNQRMNKDAESENFGCYENKPRTILIDADGKSYIAGVSIGVFQAVREIIRIFGTPETWTEPLTVVPVNVRTPRGNMLSLEVQ